ncbi:MAG: sulfite exporter TauE/SafE family protein [Sulfuricaulis sp.]|nr:sulfite exporter TauE/SafE family protein [Sulfuricaulis sp.]
MPAGSAAFEGLIATGGEPCMFGVRSRCWSPLTAEFEFGEEHFRYRPWVAFTMGMGIAILSSALGVGGGFLLVPFMALMLHLPMFVIAGTAALAIFVSSATSIANYVALGVRLDLPLLILLLAGTFLGAWLGPRLSRVLRERWLKILLTLVLSGIALQYFGVL